MDNTLINISKAKEVIEQPIPKHLIKQRDGGFGKKLDYIGGSTVINLLNKAFDYAWNFEIVSEEIVESLPKPVYEGWGKNKKPKLDKNGNQEMEYQQPYVKILGRLTIPGLCVKEQYGTKILLGGASEQEGAAKSAATDALKKCATLVGIGLELYEDAEEPQQSEQETPTHTHQQPRNNYSQQDTWNDQTTKSHSEDLKRLGELKSILGITDNSMLDIYTKEFFNNPNASFNFILPSNIKKFNEFLILKTPGM